MKASFFFLKETKNKKDIVHFCVVLEPQMIKHTYFNFHKYTFKYITAYMKVLYNIYTT